MQGSQRGVAFLVALKEHVTSPVDNGFRDPGSAGAKKDPKRSIEASSSPEYLARGILSKFSDSTFIKKVFSWSDRRYSV